MLKLFLAQELSKTPTPPSNFVWASSSLHGVDLIQDILHQHLEKGLLIQEEVMLAIKLSPLLIALLTAPSRYGETVFRSELTAQSWFVSL